MIWRCDGAKIITRGRKLKMDLPIRLKTTRGRRGREIDCKSEIVYLIVEGVVGTGPAISNPGKRKCRPLIDESNADEIC